GRGPAEDLVADREGRAVRRRVDHPGELESRRVRQRSAVREGTLAQLPVQRVDPGEPHGHPDLTLTGFRCGNLGEAKYFWAAVVRELDRSHISPCVDRVPLASQWRRAPHRL